MNLTPPEIESTVAAYRALLQGRWREVESGRDLQWTPIPEHWESFSLGYQRLRIRPQKQWRAWKTGEIPVGAVTRLKAEPEWEAMITSQKGCRAVILGVWEHADVLLATREWCPRPDGKWIPCGVEEYTCATWTKPTDAA
jgi:hypothetical protein